VNLLELKYDSFRAVPYIDNGTTKLIPRKGDTYKSSMNYARVSPARGRSETQSSTARLCVLMMKGDRASTGCYTGVIRHRSLRLTWSG
jgi:hypothetical protein